MARPQARYLPALDGLRAVAVAAVVAFHLGHLSGGFLGVDVFFVVSGFLITRLLLVEVEETGTVALGAFWSRRFRRLVPALLLVLAAVAVGSRLLLPGWRLGAIRTDGLSALAYVANWRFFASGQSYFASGIGPSPLRHTWSLAIEEQFYLVWPVVLLGLGRLAARRGADLRRVVGGVALGAAGASAVAMAVLAGGGRELTGVYYGTHTRAFAVLAGGWLATWWDPAIARTKVAAGHAARRRRDRRWAAAATAGLVGLAVLMVSVREDEVGSYRGLFQLASVLAVVTVAGLATGEGVVARWLCHAAPQWVGRRSYGIYLWSWPIQVLAVAHFQLRGLALDAVVVGLTLGLAAASYRIVEAPVLAGRAVRVATEGGPAPQPVAGPGVVATWLAGRRQGWIALGAVTVVALLVVVVAVGAPPQPTVFAVSDREAAAVALRKGSSFTTTPGEATSTTVRSVPSTTALAGPTGATATTLVPVPPGPFDPRASLVVPAPVADASAAFGRPLRVMVAGDSVGWSVAWASSRPDMVPTVQVSNRAIVGCGILPADTVRIPVHGRPEGYPATCASSAAARLLGLAEHPDVVLLWIGAWEVFDQRIGDVDLRVGTARYARLLEGQLQDLVDEFRTAGVPTVIPLVPCFGFSPVYPDERLDRDRIDWVNDRVRAVAARNRGWVRLLDPTDQLCDADHRARSQTPDGVELRPDGAHFEEDSAVWFWRTWLGGAVAGAFPAPG